MALRGQCNQNEILLITFIHHKEKYAMKLYQPVSILSFTLCLAISTNAASFPLVQ